MIKLLILGNGNPVKQVVSALNRNGIKIINVEQDRTLVSEEQLDFKSFLDSQEISLNKLNELRSVDFNMILSYNYNKIIDIEQYPGAKILNLHIGLLPKYRGNNANAWAILNGEQEIGYTIHEVTDILDGGDIYYRFKYDIRNDDTYCNGKKAINLDINKNLHDTLLSIFDNKIKPKSQQGISFVYCTKLRKSDGLIDDWNVNADFLKRKNYVFGKPLGTGLGFNFKEIYYELDKIDTIKDFEQSIGVPGSIVYIKDNNLWIKTADTAVLISGIRFNNSLIEVKKIFKIGMRLQNLRP